MISRIFPPPKGNYFLLGARGTGKSTFLRYKYGKATYVNLLDERLYQSYLANVGLFYEELCMLKPNSVVVVDEIQRLPQLLNEVHRLIEENKLTFILSGSSARKLKKAGVNLLAGRAQYCEMYPFVPSELKNQFELEEYLMFGSIPIVWSSKNKKATLKAYTQTYLKEEIQAEALVRNLPGFARFLPVSAIFHGQILNTTSIARDAEVSRTTVNGFFDILEDTLLGFKWPAFESKIRAREKRKPKFYFIDPGLARSLRGTYGKITPEERGHLFEGVVVQTLRAHKSYFDLYDDHYYWSPAEAKKTEVDCLIKKDNEFIAIECKSSSSIGASDLKGLNAISELKGLQRQILVRPSGRARKVGNIEILPFSQFLKLIKSDQLWK